MTKGSAVGNNWAHRITVPKEPMLSYKRGRSKTGRKNSIDRSISKELLARNISIEDIQTKNYTDDVYDGYHHFYQDNDSEIMLSDNKTLERIQRSKKLIAEKMLENNESRTSVVSSQRSIENASFAKKVDFSKSSSHVDQMRKKVKEHLSPGGYDTRICKSPEPQIGFAKPPLPPSMYTSNRPIKMKQSAENIRIHEED